MEKYQVAKESSLKKIKIADHILKVTYPLINDPKILKLALKNIYISLHEAMAMLLHYEKYYKRIQAFSEGYEAMLFALKPALVRYNLSTDYIKFLSEVHEKILEHKKSEVEFVRKDKFVFASKDYDLSIISVAEVNNYITKSKLFIKQAIGVVEEDERINGKC